jgi:hypothetical protein
VSQPIEVRIADAERRLRDALLDGGDTGVIRMGLAVLHTEQDRIAAERSEAAADAEREERARTDRAAAALAGAIGRRLRERLAAVAMPPAPAAARTVSRPNAPSSI